MEKKMSVKIVIAIVVILIIGGVFLFSRNGDENNIKVDADINTDTNVDDTEIVTKHKGTVTYNGETKEVEVIDHQINYFNLLELFPDFNSNALHNLKCKGTLGTIRETENAYSKGNNLNNLSGDILYIYSSGAKEITEHKIADDFSINITEYISADSVNWDEHIKMLETADKSEVLGIELLTFNAEVDNISDEDLTGKITNVYVNDKPIASNFILDSTYTVWSKDKSNVKYPASQQALASAKQKNVYKIGLEVQLEDEEGNQVCKNTVWLNLK